MWQIWALNSAVCSGGAIFHRAQTWHLKCRSSGIVEIVKIWKFWVRREIWLKRHGYWVRRPLEGWKVEGCCWGEQHLTTSQFLVFHFNPLCPTYGGVALCPHVCPTSIIWVYLCKYAYEHIAAQFYTIKLVRFLGKKFVRNTKIS